MRGRPHPRPRPPGVVHRRSSRSYLPLLCAPGASDIFPLGPAAALSGRGPAIIDSTAGHPRTKAQLTTMPAGGRARCTTACRPPATGRRPQPTLPAASAAVLFTICSFHARQVLFASEAPFSGPQGPVGCGSFDPRTASSPLAAPGFVSLPAAPVSLLPTPHPCCRGGACLFAWAGAGIVNTVSAYTRRSRGIFAAGSGDRWAEAAPLVGQS